MKVAFVSYNWPEYSLRLVSALTQDAEVCLLGPRPWGNHLHRLDQAVNFQPFSRPRFRQLFKQLRTMYKIVQTIKTFDPDVIHLQHGHLWFNLALPFLRRYPLVITIHDPRHHVGDRESQKTPQRIIDFGFRHAHQIIAHTDQMAQMVREELELPGEIIHVVPHIQLGDDTEQQHVEECAYQVLFFGRIWEYKGLEYLIKAEPLIAEQIPQVKIVIGGRGEDFDRYQRMMVNPERFVVYNEYVSDEKRAELFRQASVVALPYIEATQSGVIPIAYTFGKPVVATAVGGLPDQVENGRTGFLVPPKDEKALADAVIKLLSSPELRERLGANGKQKLNAEWSADTIAQQTLQVYERAIKNFG